MENVEGITPLNKRAVKDILADAKALAIEYHAATGRPLGITGEIAEFEAADKLGLELALVRSAGYDAVRKRGEQTETIQIKGRRRPRSALYKGRVPKIDITKPFDTVALVLLVKITAWLKSGRHPRPQW